MNARRDFKRAYRMVRVSIRGRARNALKLDLLATPTYAPDCRRCNAGVTVVEKVVAAIGWSDDLAICVIAQACRIALGERPDRELGVPMPFDFDGWAQWRAWNQGVRAARADDNAVMIARAA